MEDLEERLIERVKDAAEERGLIVKTQPSGGYKIQCPAHDDHDPSLKVDQGVGRVLLHCHAGCRTSDVLDGLGLTYRDLFEGRAPRLIGTLVCEYIYRDAKGFEIGAVQRFENPKDFRPLRPKGDHDWIVGASEEMKKTPYRADEIAEAAGQTIYVVEGEADVDEAWTRGYPATCNQAGAGKWTDTHSEHLRGRDVVIVRDRDTGGREHAEKVHKSLRGVARSVRVVDPVPTHQGADLRDHFRAGHGMDELIPVEVVTTGRRSRITWASEIEPEPVVWAWEDEGEGRIAAGTQVIAAGREGTGKSSFGIWTGAKISRGALPGNLYGTPRRVLYVTVEDSWTHTLVPRLIAAGADLTMIGRFDVITEEGADGSLSLPHDNDLLEAEIVNNNVALVVVDPLMSAIGLKIDTHKEREVRSALDPLSRIADRTGAVVLGIAHFNKSSGTDVSNMITASGAFRNVARAIFGFARDDEGRVMTQTKNSLGRDDLPSLSYSLTQVQVPTRKGAATSVRFDFTGNSDRSVRDVLREAKTDDPDGDDRREVDAWLAGLLDDNADAVPANDVFKAARGAGYSNDQIKRAKKRLGIEAKKSGMFGGWVWRRSEESTKSAKGAPSETPPPSHSSVPPSGNEPVCARCRHPSEHPLINGRCRSCAYPPGTDSPYRD